MRTANRILISLLVAFAAILPVQAQNLPGTSYIFPSFIPTLYVDYGNTSTGAQTVTLALGSVTAPTGIAINPVVASASATVGVGSNAETVSLSSVNCLTPNVYDTCQFTATFSNTHGRGEPVAFQSVAMPVKLAGSCSGTATASSTLGLYGLGQWAALTCTSTTTTLGNVMDFAGTIRTLNVSATHAGVSASSGVFTVMKNGSATTVTCTVGVGTACSDVTHQVSFNAGDVLSIQFTTQASEVLAGISAYILTY
ncbi:MAG: hypothetical protein KGL39_38480 [Patescibacteria group bacterium]|nr:hypothetical protein [Patescibacteria group bacterium]